MKSIKSLLLFFCLLCVCSGCEKKAEQEEEIHYVSAEHLLDKQEEALSKKYDNIKLSKQISVTAPESVSILESRLRENVCTKENFGMLCENFFDSYQSEEQIEQMKDDGTYLKYSDGEEEGNYGRFGQYGAVTLVRKGAYAEYEILQVFHVDRGEGEDAVYELDGKEISVLEASHFVEEWCEKYWSEIEGKQYQYKVKTAYLYQKESGAYGYRFDICKWYQGIPMNDFMNLTMASSYAADYLVASMDSTERLSYFSNQEHGPHGYAATGAFLVRDLIAHPCEGESLVGIEEALQILDQKIAAGQKMQIDEIGLAYLELPSGDRIIPVWHFAIDEEEYDSKGMRTPKNRHDAIWLRWEIFMDARTGSQIMQGSNSSGVEIIE